MPGCIWKSYANANNKEVAKWPKDLRTQLIFMWAHASDYDV